MRPFPRRRPRRRRPRRPVYPERAPRHLRQVRRAFSRARPRLLLLLRKGRERGEPAHSRWRLRRGLPRREGSEGEGGENGPSQTLHGRDPALRDGARRQGDRGRGAESRHRGRRLALRGPRHARHQGGDHREARLRRVRRAQGQIASGNGTRDGARRRRHRVAQNAGAHRPVGARALARRSRGGSAPSWRGSRATPRS